MLCAGVDAPNIVAWSVVQSALHIGEVRRVSTTVKGEGRTGSRFFVQVRQSNRKVVHVGVYHSFRLSLPSSLPLSLRPRFVLSVCPSLSFPRCLSPSSPLSLPLSFSFSVTNDDVFLSLCVHPSEARSNDGRRAAVATARMSMRRVCVETAELRARARPPPSGIVLSVRRGSLPLECDISNEMETRCGW